MASRITLPDNVTIVAPCEGGVFICTTEKTYFFAGNDIAESVVYEKLPTGAVKGTAFHHPDGKSVGWFGEDGFVIGGPDGSIATPQRDKGFIPPRAITGNTFVRTIAGETNLVCSLDGSARYDNEVSSDFATAIDRYSDDASTVCMNLSNGATSRFSNWHFTSHAKFGDEYYGMDSTGLRLLEGNTDEFVPIVAALEVGNVGMADMQICSPEFIYVSGKSSLQLVIDIWLPDGTVYRYPARSYNEDITVQRHDGFKGLMNKRQSRFVVVIRNDDGCSMEVASAGRRRIPAWGYPGSGRRAASSASSNRVRSSLATTRHSRPVSAPFQRPEQVEAGILAGGLHPQVRLNRAQPLEVGPAVDAGGGEHGEGPGAEAGQVGRWGGGHGQVV